MRPTLHVFGVVQGQQCLDLDTISDNPDYKSEFGQGCADLAAMTLLGSNIAPGACRQSEAMKNCPIACMHEIAPACYNGQPPSSSSGSLYGGSPK